MGTFRVVWLGLLAAVLVLEKQDVAGEGERYDGSIRYSSYLLSPSPRFIISENSSYVLAPLNPEQLSSAEIAPRASLTLFGIGKSKKNGTTTEKDKKEKKEKKTKKGSMDVLKSIFKSDSSKKNKTATDSVSLKEKKKEKKEEKAFLDFFKGASKKDKKEKKEKDENKADSGSLLSTTKKEKKTSSALSDLWNREKNKDKDAKTGNSTVKAEKKKKKSYLDVFSFKKDKTKNKNGTLAQNTKPKKPKKESKTATQILNLFKTAKSGKGKKESESEESGEEGAGKEPKKKRKGWKKAKHVAVKVLKKFIEKARLAWEGRKAFMERLPFLVKNATLGRLSRVIKSRLHIDIDLIEGWDAVEKKVKGCAADKKAELKTLWKIVHRRTQTCAGDSIKEAGRIIKEFKQMGVKVRGLKQEVKDKLTGCLIPGFGEGDLIDVNGTQVSRDEITSHLPNEIDLDKVIKPGEYDAWSEIEALLNSPPPKSSEEDESGLSTEEQSSDEDSDDSTDSDDSDDSTEGRRHILKRRDLLDLLSGTVNCANNVFRNAIQDVISIPERIVGLVNSALVLLQNDSGNTVECFRNVIEKERKTLDAMSTILAACVVLGI